MTVIVRPSGGRWAGVDYAGHQSVTNAAVEEAMVNAGFARWAPRSGPSALVALQARVLPSGAASVEHPLWPGSALAVDGARTGSILDRPPCSSDNASKGYSSSSVWQYGGNIYQPSTSPDATAGAWVRVLNPSVGMPCDVLGAAAVCVGGLVALKSGFTGPAIDLVATVGGTATTTTVNILSGGELDDGAVRKVLQSADSGTYVYCTKIYDQSGSGNHLNYTAVANIVTSGPYISYDVQMGRYVLEWDQYGPTSKGQGLSFPGTLSLVESSLSAFFFGAGTTSLSGPNTGVVATFGSGSGAIALITKDGAVGPNLSLWSNGTGRYPAPTESAWAPINCRPMVASLVGSSAGTTISVNENTFARSYTPNTTARSGGILGNWDLGPGRFSAMKFVGFAIGNATTSAAQQRGIKNWFYTRFNVRPQALDRVFYVSDSRGLLAGKIAGQGSACVPVLMAEYVRSDCEIVNASASSWLNSTHLSGSIPGIARMFRAGVKNICVFLLGVNDFIAGGMSPEQSAAALAANVSAVREAGYSTVVVAELAATTVTNNAAGLLGALRGLILAGASGADRVVDVSDLSPVMSPGNTLFYPDGLHPSEIVARLVAERVAVVVDQMLAV